MPIWKENKNKKNPQWACVFGVSICGSNEAQLEDSPGLPSRHTLFLCYSTYVTANTDVLGTDFGTLGGEYSWNRQSSRCGEGALHEHLSNHCQGYVACSQGTLCLR